MCNDTGKFSRKKEKFPFRSDWMQSAL